MTGYGPTLPSSTSARDGSYQGQADDPCRVRMPFWLSESGKSVTAKGADPDTLVASANAYLGALNKLMVKRQRGKPEAMVVP